MLILHAAPINGNINIWAEDSDPSPEPPDHAHPRSATAQALAEATGFMGNPGFSNATAWLPTAANTPLPSSPLAGTPPKSKAKPRLSPWQVDTVQPTAGQAARLLRQCQEQRIINPGVIIGPDLAYWAQALNLALSITARQQFLPSLSQQHGETKAVWRPVLIGGDQARLAQLAALMPPAARSLTPTGNARPPDTASQTVLKEFIATHLNHLARTGDTPTPKIQNQFDSAHDAWLHALTSQDPTLQAKPEQTQQLRRQAAEWHRPISTFANSPYRLCLRLEEPPEPEHGQQEQALNQDEWYLRYLIQPYQDHSLLLPAQAVWKNQLQAAHQDFNPAEFLLASLAHAGTTCPPINESLKNKQPAGKRLDSSQAHAFLQEQAAQLQQAGFGVLLPAWWSRQGAKTKPTIRAKTKTPPMQGGSGMSMTSLIDLNIDVALGDDPISPEELQALANLKVPLVRFRGQWMELDTQQIQAAVQFWNNKGQITLQEAVRIGLGTHQQAEKDNLSLVTDQELSEIMDKLHQKDRVKLLDTPEGFQGQLRHYQRIGHSWLASLAHQGIGACLADDMGLGKTVQTLAALQSAQEQGNKRPNLLVCPTSVINNWQRETAKFTPDLKVLVHHGTQRRQGERFQEQAAAHQVVITSYGTMNRDRELLASVPWQTLILDEAQNIKNPASQQAQAARHIPADQRIALTGTPVENHVGDLWSIMQFLNPGLLGTQAEFKRNFFHPIQQNHDPEATAKLQRATGPFILRRLKTDRTIIDDLPDKNETKQYCTLTREQATLYEAVLREAETRIESAEGIARRGSILDTLTKLKQACNHPRQLLGDNSAIAGRSGKLTRIQELLEELLPAGNRVLIFSQFAEMGAVLQQHVQETHGLETAFLHGGVPRKQRDAMVERFQNNPNGPQVFVLSLKAGGSGLNLTRANHVIHYDRWWNPAVENQATDRAFRIGQTKDVHVHKLICAGTLEDRIDLMIDIKQETADQVIAATSENWLTELSNTELHDVLKLTATPAD